ncbi:CheR family methyltransferase [Paucidesulfovibrio longus]|uniref:CheR family methyltransferase n=1 Tax=Paucidesulfovibrio longus TaxID=889 RepID=UPI0003B2FBAC|nr:protein-glutamate O-methyltransferase CheR [Paucidesulfovibrio longus]
MSSIFSKTISGDKDLKITEQEFRQLRDFVYGQCGIFIPDNRQYLMENRLSNRIKALNLKSFGEYFYFLQYDSDRRQEMGKLFEVITTNETSFFRNPPQIQVFQDTILPGLLAELRKKGRRRLRIWSAGCSTGEEPYTLAICIHRALGNELPLWDVRITANDLSARVVDAAKNGVYSSYALRTTPKDVIDQYFIQEERLFRIRPDVQRLVSFGQINLNERAQLKLVERSEVVFCRNVIIYFDEDMKRRVINAFYDNLVPDGYLFIGHSESLHNITRAFKPEHHPGAIIYKKLG